MRMNTRFRLWSAQETELAVQLMSEGADNAKCLATLGRTRQACKDRIRHCRDAAGNIDTSGISISVMNIPPHVLEDRNRRLMAPKTLTAMLMGDPPFPARGGNSHGT